jgi:phosphatidylglycerol:prolipoprotein diacylglycerol transferase
VYPILFTLDYSFSVWGHVFGPFHFYSYGLCLAVALGVCITLFAYDAKLNLSKRINLNPDITFQKVFDLAVWVIVFSLLGARLFYVLENHQEFEGKWLDSFKIYQGGLVYYGGLFGAILAALGWFKNEKWPMAYSFDLVAPYISLGQAIGRVGCFLNGCCYGVVNAQYGMVFKGGDDNLPHLPTQLWELAGDLALFFLLLWARRWTIRYPWMSLSLYGFTYGILRFVIEFWRRDWDKRYLVFFNSASQAVSGLLIVISLAVVLWALFSHRPKTERVGAK